MQIEILSSILNNALSVTILVIVLSSLLGLDELPQLPWLRRLIDARTRRRQL